MRSRPTRRDLVTRNYKQSSDNVTRAEFGNLLEDFKTNTLGTLIIQLDLLQAKQKKAIAEYNLDLFFPHYRKNHNRQECPLGMVQTYGICTKDHVTDHFP